jgi:hypothetical protein
MGAAIQTCTPLQTRRSRYCALRAYYVARGYGYYGSRRIPARSLYGRVGSIMFLDCGETAIRTKCAFDCIGISREPI